MNQKKLTAHQQVPFEPLSDSDKECLRGFPALLGGDIADRGSDPATTLFAREVRDHLEIFLETVDRCDVVFYDEVGARLVFLITVHHEEHLPMIRNAIAAERLLLDVFDIDPRDVELRDGLIRIAVPLPEACAHPAN